MLDPATASFFFDQPCLLYSTLFLFGLIFGSFFNVIVYRLANENQSWKEGRSVCEYCQQPIAWYDNIPLLSFVVLQGKCRNCQQPISLTHPVTEFLTGLVFVLAGWLGMSSSFFTDLPSIRAILLAVITIAALWLLLLIDLNHFIIPDELVAIVTLLAVVRTLLGQRQLWPSANSNLELGILVSLIITATFLFLWFITNKKGMGLGDVKLIAPLSFFLGFPRSIVGVFFAFIIGGIWGIILIALGKRKFGQVVPFGPFLVIGALIAMSWGQDLWRLYWSLI
jgi:prepilin signal peptidase PulO-like enzyme (type II secretory pathway)